MAYTRIPGKQAGAKERSINQYYVVEFFIIMGLWWVASNPSIALSATDKKILSPFGQPSKNLESSTSVATLHNNLRGKPLPKVDLILEKLEYPPILSVSNPSYEPIQKSLSYPSRIDKTLLIDVFFDINHQLLTGHASQAIQEVAEILHKHHFWEIHIQNFCDPRGNSAYNIVLGERYNQRLYEFFVHLGIPEKRIHTMSPGVNAQSCNSTSAICQAQNLWLQNGFEVISPTHSELGCTARISNSTTNPDDSLVLDNPSLTFLQPLHMASSP